LSSSLEKIKDHLSKDFESGFRKNEGLDPGRSLLFTPFKLEKPTGKICEGDILSHNEDSLINFESVWNFRFF